MAVPNVLGASRIDFHTPAGIRAPFARLATWLAAKRQAAQITFEMAKYSDRDLADMGLTRGDIPSIAAGTFGHR